MRSARPRFLPQPALGTFLDLHSLPEGTPHVPHPMDSCPYASLIRPLTSRPCRSAWRARSAPAYLTPTLPIRCTSRQRIPATPSAEDHPDQRALAECGTQLGVICALPDRVVGKLARRSIDRESMGGWPLWRRSRAPTTVTSMSGSHQAGRSERIGFG